jgi:hypothetical protein
MLHSGNSGMLWLGYCHVLTPGHGMRMSATPIAVMVMLNKFIVRTFLKEFTVLLLGKKVLQPEENRTDDRSNKSPPFASILSQFNLL